MALVYKLCLLNYMKFQFVFSSTWSPAVVEMHLMQKKILQVSLACKALQILPTGKRKNTGA